MKTLTVISGKGGTGKTSLVASFASFFNNKVMVDCDVDAANLHLLLHPEIKKSFNFKGGKLPIIDKDKCSQCGRCIEVCQFDAIDKAFLSFPRLSLIWHELMDRILYQRYTSNLLFFLPFL